MKRLIVCVVGIWMGFSIFPQALAADGPRPGEPLPSTTLPVPESPAQKDYLGLSGGGPFKISQINARIVIIEIFSMYCPHCQKEAPMVNRLYEKIENTPSLKGKIKVIGIGVGNSPFEVDVFRKRYLIPFPLFPDVDFVVHKAFGEVRTPCFVGVRLDKDGTDRVIYDKVGGLEGIDHFLDLILKASGLDPEK
jgi:thiol-disulfide isomerase/thioredoxin